MRSFRRIALVVSATSLGLGGMFALASGCSSSSSSPQSDAGGGEGGGHDGTTDSPVADSHPEASEAGVDADANVLDVIVTVDSGDASALYAFPGQLASALCTKLQQCCVSQSDAGFSLATCNSDIEPYGWSGSSFGSGFLSGGRMTLNTAAAAACLNDVANIDCSANVVTSAQATSLYNDCYGALQGIATTGQICRGSPECAPGLFCGLPNDGGTLGTCLALKANGQPCGDYGAQVANATTPGQSLALSECSYQGSGSDGLSCEIFTLDAGTQWDPSNWICFQQQAAGASCNYDIDCVSHRCDPNTFTCVSAVPFANPTECAGFPPQDAGPG
jgi:hypothetical protein